MANKSVHQIFNPDAIEHFVIDCDPYGIMVDAGGSKIETVYIDESSYLTNKIIKILEGKDDEPDMTLYKKAFIFPNCPVSNDRIKAALKEHKIIVTNDYEEANLYITHDELQKEANNGENINSRSLLNQLWNFEAIEDGTSVIEKYCEDNHRNGESARVILDTKACEWISLYNTTRHSMPYDSWMLTGLAVNIAYDIDTKVKDCYNLEKIMHQSATKCELTEQLLQDIVSQMNQGNDGKEMVGAILPTINYNKNLHFLWKLSQEIYTNFYYFNRNKDVQYWKEVSGIEDYYHFSALEMIQYLEENKKLDKETFRYLEPIVRKEISIDNRDLYTFRVEVKPEYKKLMI